MPIIASTLFFETAELTNVPDISDVHLLKEILESLGSKVIFENNVFRVDNTHISLDGMKKELFKKARATYYFIPPLLEKFSDISTTYPGGCNLGKRPIEGIVKGLEELGYTSEQTDEILAFKGKSSTENITVNAYFSVGSTIVLLLAALKRQGTTKIELAAYEPHVMNVIDILRDSGANISIRYDHSITITPSELKKHLSGKVISDYLVSGTLAIIGALTAKDSLVIHNARIEDLTAFLHVIKSM